MTDPTTAAETADSPADPGPATGRLRIGLLDLATVAHGQPVGDALRESITLARKADELGRFERLWFAEHHNMASIASAATAVVIGQVLAATDRLRVGSGGVMLPNHSPLTVAESFGTLAELYPDRVDLGLGRAPGTDQVTVRALRRDPRASDAFATDIQELEGYLGDTSLVPGVKAIPGAGTHVPLYILGSSLYGAQLAAALGLPYAFASHFAPDALRPAVAAYREQFQPSAQLAEPYVIAAANVVAADSADEAQQMADAVFRSRVRSLASRAPGLPAEIDDRLLDALVGSPLGEQARHMMTYTAVGDAPGIRGWLTDFAREADADEVMVTNAARGLDARLHALEILAEV